MAKELPYFKFTIAEWLLGRISHETYAIKGMFIDACAHYWHKECQVTEEEMERKVGKKGVQQLVSLKYLERTGAGISIAFLDEEYEELSDLKGKRSKAGKKGRAAQLGQTPGTNSQVAGHLDEIRGDKKKVEEIEIRDPKHPFFRINAEVFIMKPSEYFRTNFASYFENCQRTAGKDLAFTALDKLDTDYFGYTFNDVTHIRNSYKTGLDKLQRVKTGTGTHTEGPTYQRGQKPIGG